MPCLKFGQNPKISHKNMCNIFLAKTQRRKINTLCGDAKGEILARRGTEIFYGRIEKHEGGK